VEKLSSPLRPLRLLSWPSSANTCQMSQQLTLAEIKSRWNDVLDLVERENRVAWLAFFDARLVSIDNNQLRLSFVDAEKLSGVHDFTAVRKESHRKVLEQACVEIFGVQIDIIAE